MQIWYRVITEHFTSTVQFNQASIDLTRAAYDLYGQYEAEQVATALMSVQMHFPGAVQALP